MLRLLTFVFFTPVLAICQEVVSTQGDSYSNTSGTIDYTIGEVVIETVSDGNNDVTQGFHQTNWKFAEVEDLDPTLNISVYPNPINDQLKIETESFRGLEYLLYDQNGKRIEIGSLVNLITTVNAENLQPSIYNLVIQTKDQVKIKSFKLIKSK